MRFNAGSGPVGCLLIGRTMRMRALQERLTARGVLTVSASGEGDLLSAAQEGLVAARQPGGACVAAEGELWAAALALAVQLSVERVALIAPTDRCALPGSDWNRQIERLKGFARRNLFFCVCDVLVMEGEADARSARRLDLLCRRLCNARVHRVSLLDQRWTNCEFSPVEAVARFLRDGDFRISLAK